MTESNDDIERITVRVDDEILFRLLEGRAPLVYPDTVTRVSYASGIGVVHVGVVWALGEYNGVQAVQLEDGTVVAIPDIDPDSIVLDPETGLAGATGA